MKLRKTEIWAIAVTAVFLTAAGVRQLTWQSRVPEFQAVVGRQTLSVETETRALPRSSEGESGAAGAPVDLNTATAEELQSLSGVGEVLAERIIAYREANGGFSDPAEIKRVSGIGDAVYEANRDRLTVTKGGDSVEDIGG